MIFSTKFGDRFSNLLGIKRTKFYSDSFTFDTSVVRCHGVTLILPRLLYHVL